MTDTPMICVPLIDSGGMEWVDPREHDPERHRWMVLGFEGFGGFEPTSVEDAERFAGWLAEVREMTWQPDFPACVAVEVAGRFGHRWPWDMEPGGLVDSYRGVWRSGGEYAEELASDMGLPREEFDWMVVDWEASWECNLRHDYISFEYGHGYLYIFYAS